MDATPILRLTLEGMRTSLVTAISERHAEVEQLVEDTLTEAIANSDFRRMIAGEAQRTLRSSIDRAISSAVWELVNGEEFQRTLKAQVAAILLREPETNDA